MSELIIKKALRHNTLDKDYTDTLKQLSKLTNVFKSKAFDGIKSKITKLKKSEFKNDREFKNFLNTLKVSLIELKEILSLEKQIKADTDYIKNPDSFIKKMINSKYPSLGEFL